jgi:hypothetical protein
MALNFAKRIARERIDKANAPWSFVCSQILPTVCDEFISRDRLPIRHDRSHRYLTKVGVGLTVHSTFDNCRMLTEHLLNLTGINVEATTDDQLTAPARDMEITIVIDEAQITGVKPAIGCEDSSSCSRVAPVSLKQMGATDLNLADLTCR